MRKFAAVPRKKLLAVLSAALALFMLGWYGSRIETLREVAKNTAIPIRYQDPDYPYIKALVSVGIPNATGFPELKNVRVDVQTVIDKAKASGNATDVGVYFRLPTNAHWFGINENDTFDPGSLIKAPIMAAYLKDAEHDPWIMERRIRYSRVKMISFPTRLRRNFPRVHTLRKNCLRP
ncbi:hypothetical protein HY968_04455 [Candidatus Kaiserbacteria bacterium]|nr:hypothetical protein [Candidatus Kaiserbacteria bacterium]